MKARFLILLAVFVRTVGAVHAQEGSSLEPAPLKRADALFKAQNWAEARAAYDVARDREKDWHSAGKRRAVEGAVTCSVSLVQWDEVIRRAEDYIAHTRDSPEEAAGQRLLADLYLLMPHIGTAQGDHIVRGESGGHYPVRDLHGSDQQEAVRRLERARANSSFGWRRTPPAPTPNTSASVRNGSARTSTYPLL